MASRGPLDPRCGIARSLDLLGERWALLVVREALLGHTRFSQFRARLGLSPDVLTARLESLVAAGVLERSTYREDGARERVEYLLTTDHMRAAFPRPAASTASGADRLS